MGWWINDDGDEVDTDPDTGDVIDDDEARARAKTADEIAERVVVRFEAGATVEALAADLGYHVVMIEVALAVGRRNRRQAKAAAL